MAVETAITAASAITPVGGSLAQTAAAVRAGVSRFSEHAYYLSLDPDGEGEGDEPLVTASVPSIDPYLAGPDRLLALALPALEELFSQAGLQRSDLAQTAVLLQVPEQDAATSGWGLEEQFLPRLLQLAGLGGIGMAGVRQQGQAGFFGLLSEAQQLLLEGRVRYCIVGAVDSYLSEDRLELLDEAGLLKSARNADGFIPGEAGVFLLLELSAAASARGINARAGLGNIMQSAEQRPAAGRRHSSGEALTQVIRAVAEGLGAEEGFASIYCDLNGQSYRSHEWGLALSRLAGAFDEHTRLWHPADCYGDVGAASGGLLIGTVLEAFARDYHPAGDPLLWAASGGELRAAMTVRRAGGQDLGGS